MRRNPGALQTSDRAGMLSCPAVVDAAMTTWGFIGSGNIGSTVARLALGAGHDVVLSNSRGPETLADLVAELGPHARAATPQEAATSADVVVVTIPLRNYREVPADALRGKVVIDTMNYYPGRDGRIAPLNDETTTTWSCSRRTCPTPTSSRRSTTSTTPTSPRSPAPPGAVERSALAIAGDDDAAKSHGPRPAR